MSQHEHPEQSSGPQYPRGVEHPLSTDVAQILGPMVLIEWLGQRLPPEWKLTGPVVFSEDDVPTYLIEHVE